MRHIILPDERPHRLPFYLAMEEYIARHTDVAEAFFLWQVGPTVIFGRNQLIENEVNVAYCHKEGIPCYRRKSGGGCVYSDEGNLMLSYITRDENVNLTFNRYVNLLVLALYRMGIEAVATGRNDILIGGCKVSGNAFYHLPGCSIVHGTLLYDTNMDHMTQCLTPPREKLQSKGVDSIRQHITLLKEHTTLPLSAVKQHLVATLCDGEYRLGADDVAAIRTIEDTYLTDAFIYGHNPRYTLVRRGRIDGVGSFEVRLEMKNGVVKSADILGDYFLVGDLEEGLLPHLLGTRLERESLEASLPQHLDDIILHLRREDFIHLLIGTQQ